MTPKNRAPKTAVDLWNHAVREAFIDDRRAAPGDALIDLPDVDVLKMSDAEVEKYLLAAGVDLEECDAKADATYEQMLAKLAERKPSGSK